MPLTPMPRVRIPNSRSDYFYAFYCAVKKRVNFVACDTINDDKIDWLTSRPRIDLGHTSEADSVMIMDKYFEYPMTPVEWAYMQDNLWRMKKFFFNTGGKTGNKTFEAIETCYVPGVPYVIYEEYMLNKNKASPRESLTLKAGYTLMINTNPYYPFPYNTASINYDNLYPEAIIFGKGKVKPYISLIPRRPGTGVIFEF